MSKFYSLILCITTGLFIYNANAQNKKQRIKNGEDVLIENHPYQADLGGCGGTIIGPTWIVTAQHCLGGIVGRTIGVGYTKRSNRSTGQTSVVKRALTFPCGRCDLALLELETPLDLSGTYAKAIRYASADVFTEGYVLKDQECYATGWGRLSANGPTPDNLQGALLKFGTVQLSDQRIRVEETEGRMVCRGDSGGPLVVYNSDKSERILVGAVSGGEGTPCSDYGFWGNIANAASWIEEQTGIEPYKEGTSPLGISDRAKKVNFNIWPVPANDIIHITSEQPIKAVKIYNLLGNEVLYSDQTANIELSSLSNGTYVLQDEESLGSRLFVIKR